MIVMYYMVSESCTSESDIILKNSYNLNLMKILISFILKLHIVCRGILLPCVVFYVFSRCVYFVDIILVTCYLPRNVLFFYVLMFCII